MKLLLKTWLRSSGIAGFATLLVIAALMYFYVLPGLLAKQLQSVAESLFEAQVEIDSASLTISPLGLQLKGISIANAQDLERNVFEADALKFQLSLLQWVHGSIVIDELSAKGLQLDTLRTHKAKAWQGEPAQADEAENEQGDSNVTDVAIESIKSGLPTITAPDTDAILKDPKLKTNQTIAALQQQQKQAQNQWPVLEAAIADSAEHKRWESEAESLLNLKLRDLAHAKQQHQRYLDLRQELQQELKDINAAKQFLQSQVKQTQTNLKQLRNAPNQDYRYLRQQYWPSSSSLDNVSQLLFGPKAQELIDHGRVWVPRLEAYYQNYQQYQQTQQKAEPPSVSGEDVAFQWRDPQPKFIIKRVIADLTFYDRRYSVIAKDINFEHRQFNKISSAELSAYDTEAQAEIEITAVVDRRKADPNDRYQLRITQLPLKDLVLSNDDSLPLIYALAQLDLKIDGRYLPQGFNAEGAAQFSQLQMQPISGRLAPLPRMMRDVFSELEQFQIQGEMDGNWRLSVRSDLDKKLSGAFSRRLKAEQDKQAQAVKQALAEQAAKVLADVPELQGYQQRLAALSSDDQSIQAVLADSLEDPLRRYQAEQEAKAKAKADKKLDAEKERLKQKLKNLF